MSIRQISQDSLQRLPDADLVIGLACKILRVLKPASLINGKSRVQACSNQPPPEGDDKEDEPESNEPSK